MPCAGMKSVTHPHLSPRSTQNLGSGGLCSLWNRTAKFPANGFFRETVALCLFSAIGQYIASTA